MKAEDKGGIYGSRMFRRMLLLTGILCTLLFAGASLLLTGVLSFGLRPAAAEILLLILCLAGYILLMLMGRAYFRSMNSLGEGINRLSEGEPVHIYDEGMLPELISSLNKASEIQQEQKRSLEKRDDLRMEWICGVSHDIRTPLSMVMGYAEDLEEDEELTAEQHSMASSIKEQALRIKELIEDLNLLSKLEYKSQPLRLSDCSPAGLIRNVAAEFMNRDSFVPDQGGKPILMGRFDIELVLFPEFEKLSIPMDMNLIKRVLQNIIGNSIRHNPEGCNIMIFARRTGDRAVIDISDDGIGIPERVAACINSYGSELRAEAAESHTMEDEDRKESPAIPHIMGMRIAKRIMLSHGGNMMVKPDLHTVSLILWADNKKTEEVIL